VAGFNDDTSVTQDFTDNVPALSQGIEKLSDRGETALFDAIYYACWKLAAYPEQGRVARVLVVLTDGEDNSSHRSLKQAIEAAEAAGVTVYTVSTLEQTGLLFDPAQTDANKVLKVLAERSGGQAFFPGSLKALDWYLDQLRDVIRSRYLIAYKAANFAPNGKYRSIHVRAEKDGKHFHVQVRKGYYARLAMNSNGEAR
jgi:VWFA-related protein